MNTSADNESSRDQIRRLSSSNDVLCEAQRNVTVRGSGLKLALDRDVLGRGGRQSPKIVKRFADEAGRSKPSNRGAH